MGSKMLLLEPLSRQPSTGSTTSETILLDDLAKPLPTKPSWQAQHVDWRRRKSLSGWRFGLRIAAFTTLAVLIVNIILLIVAVTAFRMDKGIGIAFQGDCNRVDGYATLLHILINMTGSVLLAASNYAMQCLAAPSRAECDRAHAKGDWLDIGVLSARNLFKLSRLRVFLWIILLTSSIPIHLLYNSTVFKTLNVNYYRALVIDDDFLLGKPLQFNISTWPGTIFTTDAGKSPGVYMDMQAGYLENPSSYTFMPMDRCLDEYARDFVSRWSTLFLVTNGVPQGNPTGSVFSPPMGVSQNLLEIGRTRVFPPYSWLCADQFCDAATLLDRPHDFTILRHHIDHCVAEEVPMRCQLNFSSTLLAIVVICNFLKASIIVYVLRSRSTTSPLVILGDAIESFVQRPDNTHESVTMMNATDVKFKIRLNKMDPTTYLDNARAMSWDPTSKPLRWAKAISPFLWTMISILWLVSISGTGFLFWFADLWANTFLGRSYKIGSTFGNVDASMLANVYANLPDLQLIIVDIMIANFPQLLMSIAYLLYNSCFTSMLSAHEWSSYATSRLPLRVSTPVGKQLGTYWLHLPYMYGIPLLVVSALMHWLISESVFLARITTRRRLYQSDASIESTVGIWSHNAISGQFVNGSKVPAWYKFGNTSDIFYPNLTSTNQGMTDRDIRTTSALGYSITPILCCIIVAVAMYLALLSLAFLRRFNSNMPLVMSCSLAIANACRPETGCSSTAPLQWRNIGDRWSFTAKAPPEGDTMDLATRPWWCRLFSGKKSDS